MNEIRINDNAEAKFKPFLDVVLNNYKDKIHSIHIIGSALIEDFNAKTSDINSILVLKKFDLKFLEDFAPLGKKFGKKQISSPLIMTPEYVSSSLDVFPIEFLTIKILHKTIFGDDVFNDLEIKKSDLRYQCERELKVKLIGIRQGYLSSSGNKKLIAEGFITSFSGYIPLFRALILLLGEKPPEQNKEVLTTLQDVSNINTDVFKIILNAKKEGTKLPVETLNTIFEDYYQVIEKLGYITDAIED